MTRQPKSATQQTDANGNSALPAGLVRRLAALLYDGLVCIALALVTTGIYTMIAVRLTGAEVYRQQAAENLGKFDPLLASILFVILYGFFAYFWRHNGQTLGMQAWHLRIENDNGSRITWMQALLRYLMGWVSLALLGAGHFWMLVDREHKTWTDRFSYSRMVRMPPRQKS